MTSQTRGWKPVEFTVDAALLRELGERLVGEPHIALAELVKNSFDADANRVTISFNGDKIEVADDGHGMSFRHLNERWMRVGSPHKVEQRESPKYGRPLTGSKGIGRLAVQFLASELFLSSTVDPEVFPDEGKLEEVRVAIDWSTAVTAPSLTKARALYDLRAPSTVYPDASSHGTVVVLSNLQHDWEPEDFQSLAGAIWFLQPPFRSREAGDGARPPFSVELVSNDPEAEALSERQVD